MTFKSFLVAAALSVATAGSASAAIFTATVTGTVSSVRDNHGFFSDIEAGDAFTYSMSFDMVGASTYGQNNIYYYGNTYSYQNISATLLGAQMTVNGKAVANLPPMTTGYAGMSDYSRIGYQDYWNVQSSGSNYTGWSNTWTNIGANVNAYNMTGTTLDFSREYTHTVSAGDYSNFYANTGYWDSYGYNYWDASVQGQVETISFNAVNDVPEPAGVALMALGLIAIGAVRRRKAARA